ncbi:flagellar basal-body MS-ring/collar protein FliF [Vagococcus fluvialis]|uniref:flagellar basal-body MS-ring/collar protein FliF n=1 Tax=Vagococcus fluvialis TaxID=2738 RepID=UPI003D129E69
MNKFQELKDSLLNKWRDLNRIKQISIVLASISVIVIILLSTFMLNKTDYSVLFSDLSDEESGQITKNLDENTIKYKLEDKGSKILVDSKMIDKVRIELAVENKLPNKSTGFELFDEKNMMATDEDRKIMYQRAVTGEIQRAIESLEAVNQAKVMLVTPDKSIFEEKNKESSASIVLKLNSNQSLNEEAIKGIALLTSGAVENLPKKNIKIVDEQGNVLSDGLEDTKSNNASDLASKYQTLKDSFEEKLEGKASRLLGTLYKENDLNLAINVDLDFDSIEKTTIKYAEPEIRSEVIQATGDELNPGRIEGATARDNATNVVGNTANGTKSYSHTINNELDTETTKVLNAPGVVKRVTASVLINGNLSVQEKNQLEELVQSAIGYERERGDKVTVQAIKVGEEEVVIKDDTATSSNNLLSYIKQPLVLGSIIAVLSVLGILIFLLIRKGKKKDDLEDLFDYDLDVTKDIVAEPKVIKSEKQTENSTSEEFEQVVKDIEINHQKLIKDDLDNELLAREKQQLKESMDKENQAKKYAKDNPELAAELIKVWMKDK